MNLLFDIEQKIDKLEKELAWIKQHLQERVDDALILVDEINEIIINEKERERITIRNDYNG